MRANALLIFVLFLGLFPRLFFAQEKYLTSAGEVIFDASSPLEDIRGTNTKVNAIYKPDAREFGVVMLLSEFEFRRRLMREHFNENYVESEKYPKSTFSGQFQDLNLDELDSTARPYKLSGQITLHGVTKPLEAEVYLSRSDDGLVLRSEFQLQTADFEIKIPKVLFRKVAEVVNVTVNLKLDPAE